MSDNAKELDYPKTKTKIKMEVGRKYLEDEHFRMKEEEEKAQCEAAGIDWDRYLKKKRAPLKKLRSFTECGLKYEETLEL